MEEQMLFNQIKSLIEEKIHGLKKEIQELKGTLTKNIQMDKVDLGNLSQNDIKVKKQTTDYKLIDLGLPSGTLWMDRNIGASSPTDFGLYFAWGETKGYTADEVGKVKNFSWADYKYANGDYDKLTKYCNDSSKGNKDYTDNFVTLQPCDDVVYLLTNGKCSIPTREQIQELLDNTTYGWSAMDGVKGGLFTSKINGNSIFVPAAGICFKCPVNFKCSVNNVGVNGRLWSSSLCEDGTVSACRLYFNSEEVSYGNYSRYYGYSVRGVAK